MPKINQQLLSCAVYLYRTREDAETGSNYGGTGFLVGVRSIKDPSRSFIYAISNWHTAMGGGNSVVRVNTVDGGIDTFEFGPEDWEKDPNGYDLAAVPFAVMDHHNVSFIGINDFVTPQFIQQYQIGVGDNVFMIGRFIDHDGGPTNRPAARFGHISVMPTKMEMPTGRGESFCVDVHSRTGYSGSPVFSYRTLADNLDNPNAVVFNQLGYLTFLGVHWSQFPEEWELKSDKPVKEYVRGMSGMTCVIPAWHISGLLNAPRLIHAREIGELQLEAKLKK